MVGHPAIPQLFAGIQKCFDPSNHLTVRSAVLFGRSIAGQVAAPTARGRRRYWRRCQQRWDCFGVNKGCASGMKAPDAGGASHRDGTGQLCGNRRWREVGARAWGSVMDPNGLYSHVDMYYNIFICLFIYLLICLFIHCLFIYLLFIYLLFIY